MILFVKDIEKSMVGNNEACAVIRAKIEKLPANVVVIGSHTQMDNRKEKVRNLVCYIIFSVNYHNLFWHMDVPTQNILFTDILFVFQSHPGGLLFTKFGGNQTALLDLAFPVREMVIFFEIF